MGSVYGDDDGDGDGDSDGIVVDLVLHCVVSSISCNLWSDMGGPVCTETSTRSMDVSHLHLQSIGHHAWLCDGHCFC